MAVPSVLTEIDGAVLRLVSPGVVRAYRALPVRLEGQALIVAVADGSDQKTLRAIQFAVEREVKPLVVTAAELDAAIEHHFGSASTPTVSGGAGNGSNSPAEAPGAGQLRVQPMTAARPIAGPVAGFLDDDVDDPFGAEFDAMLPSAASEFPAVGSGAGGVSGPAAPAPATAKPSVPTPKPPAPQPAAKQPAAANAVKPSGDPFGAEFDAALDAAGSSTPGEIPDYDFELESPPAVPQPAAARPVAVPPSAAKPVARQPAAGKPAAPTAVAAKPSAPPPAAPPPAAGKPAAPAVVAAKPPPPQPAAVKPAPRFDDLDEAMPDISLDDLAPDVTDLRPAASATAASASRKPPPGSPVLASSTANAEPADPSVLDNPSAEALKLISSDTARSLHALPVALDNGTLTIAFAAEPDVRALRALQYASGKLLRKVLVPESALELAILRHYPARAAKAVTRPGVRIPEIESELLKDRMPDIIALIKVEVARKIRAVPIELVGRRLKVAMADPGDLKAIQDLEFVSGRTVNAFGCDLEALDAAIEYYYPPEAAIQAASILADADLDLLDSVEVEDERGRDDTLELTDRDDEAPAVRMINMLIRNAVFRGASDMHIETYETWCRVRYRIDGILYEVANPPMALRNSMISRIKVMSKMDIAETRMPQDGRIKLKMRDGKRVKPLDFRVSTIPTMWGERIALRILDPDKLMLDISKLGFDKSGLDRFTDAIAKPYGMVLVVGPSGCGKTNTLYSAMSSINDDQVNIMTAEDPVEFNIRGINQVQTLEAIGLSFAASLRSFLRQDPNIILVGEIRDYETAEIAVKASLTGHLVLSTLHTTDAPTTISRLVNMGVEPFLVATSVLLISAQRLVRKICVHCPIDDPRDEAELLDVGFLASDLPVMPKKGAGCEQCHQTGYRGRTALFEVLSVTDEIRELILQGATPIEVKTLARSQGMQTLRDNGLSKVREGVSSIAEITRETVR